MIYNYSLISLLTFKNISIKNSLTVLESENGLYSSSPGGTFLVTCVTDGSWNEMWRGKKFTYPLRHNLQSICFICTFGHPAKLTEENKEDYQIYLVPFQRSWNLNTQPLHPQRKTKGDWVRCKSDARNYIKTENRPHLNSCVTDCTRAS